jgi:YD repeat-containing protein
LTDTQRLAQAACGVQNLLVLASVPTGADQSLRGRALSQVGALTAPGNYDVLVPLAGIASTMQVHLTATIASGTASTSCSTTYLLTQVTDPSGWTTKTAFTGTGSLTTTVRQTASLSTLAGEQYAWLRITLASSPNVIFTQAEYNGV